MHKADLISLMMLKCKHNIPSLSFSRTHAHAPGHRPSLLDYHDTKLRLKGKGFELESVVRAAQSAVSRSKL
jgi:hypothetical protein